MLINTNKFAFAMAIATGALWVICSAQVMLFPQFMTGMTGHMMHMGFPDGGLILTARGFVLGLVGWMVSAGAFGWFTGTIYNLMAGRAKN